MPQKHYKLLIFDWDGTLVDSIKRIATSLQAASHQICQASISDSQARNVIGLGLQEAIQQLHPELEPNRILQIAQAYKHHYINENTVDENPFEGSTQLLRDLRQKGYYLAIATGKSRIGFDHSATKFAMKDYFHNTQCSGENHSKPHPQMLLKILDAVDITVEDSVMIGDSMHDLKMAQNAGMDSIAVTHGVHSKAELSDYNPLVCLDRITDLQHFLQLNETR